MRAPAKPPQRERNGAEGERNGGGEGGEGAGKAKRSGESGGGATTMGARKKKKKTKHQSTAHANTEVSKERKKHDAPDWSIRGEGEHGPSPRTGSSGVNPVPRTGASEATG